MRLRIFAFLVVASFSCAAQSTAICTNQSPCICVYTIAGGAGSCKLVPISSVIPQVTLTIGTVATLPAGSPATASITGASPHFVLNLGIPAGQNGTNGESAYQVAVDNGFVGTEQQWLASLVGPQGNPGPMIPGLSVSADGKTLLWGDGTAGWSFTINSSGTMYNCTPTQGAMICGAQ